MRHIVAAGIFATAILTGAQSQAAIHVEKSVVELPETGVFETTVVTTQSNKLTFIAPQNFSGRESPDSLAYVSGDGATALVFKITRCQPPPSADDGSLRGLVTRAYPGAEILQTQQAFSNGKPARYYDIVRSGENGAAIKPRHAYIPFNEGLVEVILNSPPAEFETRKWLHSRFLTALKMEPFPSPRR